MLNRLLDPCMLQRCFGLQFGFITGVNIMTEKQKLYAQLHRIAIKMKPGHVRLPPHWRIGVRMTVVHHFLFCICFCKVGLMFHFTTTTSSNIGHNETLCGAASLLLDCGELLVQGLHFDSHHCKYGAFGIAILWPIRCLELGHGRHRCSFCGHLRHRMCPEIYGKPDFHVRLSMTIRGDPLWFLHIEKAIALAHNLSWSRFTLLCDDLLNTFRYALVIFALRLLAQISPQAHHKCKSLSIFD